jgi:flagellar hook-length control protein FliK
MDQTSFLSDTISKSSSLLSGLLSQMNSSLGGDSSQDDLFSSLLSQSDALQQALAAQTQTTPAVTATPASNTTSNIPASSTQDASSQDQSTNNSLLVQKLNDIAQTIRKILAALPHKNQNTASQSAKQQPVSSTSTQSSNTSNVSSSTTQTAAPTQTTTQTTPVSTNTAPKGGHSINKQLPIAKTGLVETADPSSSDATQPDPDSTTTVAQTLSDVMVELLAMIQLALQNLEKTKIAGGTGTTATATSATSATPTQDALSLTDLDIVAGAGTNSNEITPLSPAQLAAADLSMTESLLQLIKTLQKDAQSLIASDAGATTTSAGTATSTTSAATAALTTSDIETQFTTLEQNLKQSLAALHQQMQPMATANKSLAAAADADAATSASALTTTTKTTTDEALPKSSDPATPTTQFYATAAAAQPQANADTSAATDPSTSAANTVAAFNSKESTSTDSDTNSDFLSSKNHTASSANNASSQSAGMTAEGLSATGTYSFASTLSAIRATNGGSTGLPSVVDQVILQMNRNVKSGNDQMSLQLHPSDLGKITVKLDFSSDGKVQGTVTADNPKTLEMLQKDSRSLERALQDAGLRTDPGSLQFNLGGQSGNGAGQASNNGNQGTDSSEDGTISAQDNGGLVDVGAISETYYVTPTGVNIRV